jgi:hypothetical protein
MTWHAAATLDSRNAEGRALADDRIRSRPAGQPTTAMATKLSSGCGAAPIDEYLRLGRRPPASVRLLSTASTISRRSSSWPHSSRRAPQPLLIGSRSRSPAGNRCLCITAILHAVSRALQSTTFAARTAADRGCSFRALHATRGPRRQRSGEDRAARELAGDVFQLRVKNSYATPSGSRI